MGDFDRGLRCGQVCVFICVAKDEGAAAACGELACSPTRCCRLWRTRLQPNTLLMLRATQVRPATATEEPLPRRYPACKPLRWIIDALAVTPEWNGQYSVDKTLALLAYTSRSSTIRSRIYIIAWTLTAPLCALIVPLLLELIPLNDPVLGWRCNLPFFLRVMVRGALLFSCSDRQIELYLPDEQLSLVAARLMNIVQGGLISCGMLLFSACTGVFPIPFTIVAATPLYGVVGWGVRFAFEHCLLPVHSRQSHNQQTQQRLPQVIRLTAFGMPLLFVYNSFASGFSQVPHHYQAVMAVLLQLIKLLLTHVQWRISQIEGPNESAELDTARDLSTAQVASGVRFFHALFTTTCLQKSKSASTLVVIVFFSLLQEWNTLRGLSSRERSLARTAKDLTNASKASFQGTHHTGFSETLAFIADKAQRVNRQGRASGTQSSQQLRASPTNVPSHSTFCHQEQVAVTPRPEQSSTPAVGPLRRALTPLTAYETAFLESATSLLQCQESVLLSLYIEIFVPLLFSAYTALVQYSPNIQFLPPLNHSDSRYALAERLIIQVAIKVVALAFILHRHCREPGGLRQLGFALSSMQVVMVYNCVLNALCVFDFPLLHNGHDFTFQFKWLRHHP